MPLKAILLGSLGTLAETSELRRRALNAAFAEAGLGWSWSVEEHRRPIADPGACASAVRAYARGRGVRVNAEAICLRQGELFRDSLAHVRVPPRPGLSSLIKASRAANLDLALVTTAPREDVDAMLAVTGLDRAAFAFVGDADAVAAPKPAPDIYLAALKSLSITAQQAIAIEETQECAETARALGIQSVSFPGALHAGPYLDVSGGIAGTVPVATQVHLARSA